MEYKVMITEISRMSVSVKADSETDAEQTVAEKWRNSEYILDYNNFCDVKFNVEGETEYESQSIYPQLEG